MNGAIRLSVTHFSLCFWYCFIMKSAGGITIGNSDADASQLHDIDMGRKIDDFYLCWAFPDCNSLLDNW